MTTIGLTTRDVARELARRYSTMTHDELDVLQPLVEEEQISPSEYYEFVHKLHSSKRKRATGRRTSVNNQVD